MIRHPHSNLVNKAFQATKKRLGAARKQSFFVSEQQAAAWQAARTDWFATKGKRIWNRQHLQCLKMAANPTQALIITQKHTAALDALYRMVFAAAAQEMGCFIAMQLAEWTQELQTKTKKLHAITPPPSSFASIPHTEKSNTDKKPQQDAEAQYQTQLREQIRDQVLRLTQRIGTLQLQCDALQKMPSHHHWIQQHLVVFARGGYGRGEVSLASDVDTGYCVDNLALSTAAQVIVHSVVLRCEALLQLVGIQPAHQFLEIGEDLSRFTDKTTLHSLMAILEARPLAGSTKILTRLVKQCWQVLPTTRLIQQKQVEYAALGKSSLQPDALSIDPKHHQGGLRALQTALWAMGVLYRVKHFQTEKLLEFAVQRGLLSVQQTQRWMHALHWHLAARNAMAAFQLSSQHNHSPHDSEAHHTAFPSLATYQLFSTPTLNWCALSWCTNEKAPAVASNWSTTKQHWLRELNQALHDGQALSAHLLNAALDRTHWTPLSTCEVAVHLQSSMVTAMRPLAYSHSSPTDQSVPLNTLLQTLFELLKYIAQTGYQLAPSLQDHYAGMLVTDESLPFSSNLLKDWHQVLIAPFASQAMDTLFAIRKTTQSHSTTAMGLLFPAYAEADFYPALIHGYAVTLHTHLANSLANTQTVLFWLKQQHPELHQLLTTKDLASIQWAVFLHGLLCLPAVFSKSSHLVSMKNVKETLATLDIFGVKVHHALEDSISQPVLFLLTHHTDLLTLLEDSTYEDKVLTTYLKKVKHDLIRAVQLYVVNASIFSAIAPHDHARMSALQRCLSAIAEVFMEAGATKSILSAVDSYLLRKKNEQFEQVERYLLIEQFLLRGMDATCEEALGSQWAVLKSHPVSASLRTLLHATIADSAAQSPSASVSTTDNPISPIYGATERLLSKLGKQKINLTAAVAPLQDWFFALFPNRYLLNVPSQVLARQIMRFIHFETAEVIVDILPTSSDGVADILLYTQGLEHSHLRVTYALWRHKPQSANIIQGKINPVEMPSGKRGYGYHFQITGLRPHAHIYSPELETMIENFSADKAQPLMLAAEKHPSLASKPTISFSHSDGKSYQVTSTHANQYQRKDTHWPYLAITAEDQPLFLHRLCHALAAYNVEPLQCLLSLNNGIINDWFYLLPADHERLQQSDFAKRLPALLETL